MMKSYLTQLRSLSIAVAAQSPDRIQETDILAATIALEKQICLEMDKKVASKGRDLVIRRHLLQLQRLVLQLLNDLTSDFEVTVLPESPVVLFREFLLRLIAYHQNNYPHYFAFDDMVPVVLKQQFLLKIQQSNLILLATLKNSKITGELQNVLMAYYNFNPQKSNYTFAQLSYLTSLQNAIIKLFKEVVGADYEALLLEYLILLNFNARPLVMYLKNELQLKLSVIFNEQERYFLLCQEEYRLQCIAVKQYSVFDSTQDSLKMQLLDTITAGIVFYHRQQANQTAPFQQMIVNENYRIRLTISADLLAYLIRLLIEAGIIEAEPRSKLMVFLAAHCQTAGIGAAKLSANSLNTKYKQVVQRTAIGVRSLLRKMVKIVDQNFEIS